MTAQFLLLCATFVGQVSAAAPVGEGLKWQTDLASAQRQARESGRLVLIHFGGTWCEPCCRLERNVFSQPGFGRDLSPRYVAVKIDPRQQHQVAEKYGVRTVPCDVVTTPAGQLVIRLESPTTAAAYTSTLNHVADNVLGPAPQATLAAAPHETAIEPPAQLNATQPPPLDRYADYYNRRRPASAPATAPAAPSSTPPASNIAASLASTAPNAAATAQPPAADAQRPSAAPAQPPAVASVSNDPPASTAKNPPFALDRYCPVTLVEKRRWEHGNEQWGAIHRGRTYLFVSEAAQKAFLANPDRYSPVCAGNDPVLRVEYHQDVPGKREHGAFYNNRIYLFTSEDTFLRFDRNPARYMTELSRQVQRR
jgi:YHS domain-containing protein/thioredoxin-related protein